LGRGPPGARQYLECWCSIFDGIDHPATEAIRRC
jgi:hypothetical protein